MPSTTAYTLLLSPLSPSLPVLHAMSGLMLLSLIPTVLLGFSVALSAAELQRFEHAAKADGSLSLLVVGDWGRRGAYNQTEVALQVTVTYNLLLLITYLYILQYHTSRYIENNEFSFDNIENDEFTSPLFIDNIENVLLYGLFSETSILLLLFLFFSSSSFFLADAKINALIILNRLTDVDEQPYKSVIFYLVIFNREILVL